MEHDDGVRWIYAELRQSTCGLTHDLHSAVAACNFESWLGEMFSGSGSAHVQGLYIPVDLRGSDVRLDSQAGRQTMPYLAFVWEWCVVHSYFCHPPPSISVCLNSLHDFHGLYNAKT